MISNWHSSYLLAKASTTTTTPSRTTTAPVSGGGLSTWPPSSSIPWHGRCKFCNVMCSLWKTRLLTHLRCGMAYDRRSVSKEAVEARKRRTGPGSIAPTEKISEKTYWYKTKQLPLTQPLPDQAGNILFYDIKSRWEYSVPRTWKRNIIAPFSKP